MPVQAPAGAQHAGVDAGPGAAGASSQHQAAPPQEPEVVEDDDLLADAQPDEPSPDRMDPYFQQVFDQFVAVKKSCNETIAGLIYYKFAEKLIRNRDELRSKTGCREVRFTVYVKDGKAALKATPVKEDGKGRGRCTCLYSGWCGSCAGSPTFHSVYRPSG